MATNISTEQIIDELVTCTICFEHFDDPRVLPCSHTYCLKCIRGVAARNNSQFECPLRDGTILTTEQIPTLPFNRIALHIVEELKKCKFHFIFNSLYDSSDFI